MSSKDLKIGTKVILIDKHRDQIVRITVDEIVKENKFTFSTKKKQLITKRYSDWGGLYFHNNYSSDRKRVECDVTGKQFSPERVQIYKKDEHTSMVKSLNDYIAKIAAKEEAARVYEEKHTAAFAEYNKIVHQAEQRAHQIKKDSFFKFGCGSCKNKKEDGTCSKNPDFGILETTTYVLWMCSGCYWQPIES